MPKKKKDEPGKKAQQKKREKILEDKTFGMKNKNKSKKVQNEINSIRKTVLNSGSRQERMADEKKKQAKAAAKARKQAEKQERDALFGEALLAVKKKTSTNVKGGQVESKGRDGNDESEKKSGTSKAMKLMYQMDAQEAEEKLMEDPNYVRTIEDEIESERQAMFARIKASGKKLTPVTEISFRNWIEQKRKRKEEEVKKKIDAEMKKKKGGKGLSILSGRELYMYNQGLFKDQEDDNTNEEEVDLKGEKLVEKVQADLFLDGDDADLDDLDDD